MSSNSTIFSFKADTKDFDAKLNSVKKAAEDAMIGVESSTMKATEAQKKLDTAMGDYNKRIATTKSELTGLKDKQAQGIALTVEEAKRVEELTKEVKSLEAEKKKVRSELNAEILQHKRAIATNRVTANSYKSMAREMDGVSTASKKQVDNLQKEDKARKDSINELVRHIRKLETLAVAYYAVTRAYQNTFGAGVQLNREYENMELGIAAVIASKTQAVDVTGKETDALTKFMVAQKQTKDVLADIKKAAMETPATFSQMVGFYQQAIGHALASNGAFGASIQEVNTNTIQFTKRISALASSVGMSMDLVNEEVRSLMSGDVTSDSKLALILFGSPTKANEAIKEAKKQVGGLTELFDEKLSQFAILDNIDTYDKNVAKAIGLLDTLRKEAAKPIFDDISQGFKDLAIYLEANGDRISDYIQQLYALGKAGLQYADDVAKIYVAYKVGGAVATGIITVIGLVTKLNEVKKASVALTKSETVLEIMKNAVTAKGLAQVAVGAGATYAAYEGISYLLEKISEDANKAYGSLKQLEDIKIAGEVDVGTYKQFDVFGEEIINKQQLIDGLNEAERMLKMHQASLKDAVKKNNEVMVKESLEAIMFYKEQVRNFSVDLKDYIQLKMLQTDAENKSKSALKAEAKAFEDMMKRRLEIENRGELLGLDDVGKKKRALYQQYEADLAKYKDIQGAKLILTREYNEKYDAIEKESADKRLRASIKQSQKDFEAEQTLRKLSIGLMSDETDKKIALANLAHEDRLQELANLKELGDITQEHYARRVHLENAAHKQLMDGYSTMGVVFRNATDTMSDGLEEFFDSASEGFLDFGNLAQDVLNQILKDMIKLQVVKPLVGNFNPADATQNSGLSGLIGSFGQLMFSAKGNVMPSTPSLSQHSNTVVSQPTPFFFANGGVPNLGIMGEAGSEAILPLTRTSDGDLGVKSVGGSNVVINIENNTSSNIEMEQISSMMKTNQRGEEEKVINIVIKNAQQNSGFRNALRNSLGA